MLLFFHIHQQISYFNGDRNQQEWETVEELGRKQEELRSNGIEKADNMGAHWIPSMIWFLML